MKKVLICLGLFLVTFTNMANAQNSNVEIELAVSLVDPTSHTTPIKKAPVNVPSVTIDGYILSFITPCDGCTLRLINEDGVVEYTTVITSTILELPSEFEGEYEIQIIRGRFCFYGYIELPN